MKLIYFLPLLLLPACQTNPTYDQSLGMRPEPRTIEEKKAECDWIRIEIARQKSFLDLNFNAQPANQYGINMGAVYAKKVPSRVASLENRAANLNCQAAFSNPSHNSLINNIKQCISACKENTKRSSEACFDSCNK